MYEARCETYVIGLSTPARTFLYDPFESHLGTMMRSRKNGNFPILIENTFISTHPTFKRSPCHSYSFLLAFTSPTNTVAMNMLEFCETLVHPQGR